MSDIKLWFVNNDMLIEVSELKNAADGSYIDDATVLATLKDDQDQNVSGITWPVTLNFTGTSGLYRATVDKAAAVVDDAAYTLLITATNPGNLDAEWEMPVGGEIRR